MTDQPKLYFDQWAHEDLRRRDDYEGLMADAEALLRTMGHLPDDPMEARKAKETAALMAVAVIEPGEMKRLVPHPILERILAKEPKPPERQTLGYPVEVVEPLEVYAFMGGWGDGPLVQHPGSRLYLTHSQDGQVFFTAGSAPSPSSIHVGGQFPEGLLAKVRRLDDEGPIIHLTPADGECFGRAILEPPPSSPALLRATERLDALTSDQGLSMDSEDQTT